MATPLGSVFSTAENQVSQCDEQIFGSNFEFKKAGAARAPLAKSSREVSAETEKVFCEPTVVLWRNQEACLQHKSCTLENLVVQFNQGRFEEVLSGGGLMPRARKHRKVSMTKVSKHEPEVEFCQHPSTLRVANQVPCEPKYLCQSGCGSLNRSLWPKPQA